MSYAKPPALTRHTDQNRSGLIPDTWHLSRNTLQVIDFKRWTQAAFCFFGAIFGGGPITSLIPATRLTPEK
jgi:hypothetical protein